MIVHEERLRCKLWPSQTDRQCSVGSSLDFDCASEYNQIIEICRECQMSSHQI